MGGDKLYKIIHGKICLGGTQYQTLKKEQTTTEEETVAEIKQEVLPLSSKTLKGKGRGKSSKKK